MYNRVEIDLKSGKEDTSVWWNIYKVNIVIVSDGICASSLTPS